MELRPTLWRDMDRSVSSMLNEVDRPFASWRPMLRQLDDMFNEMASVWPTTETLRASVPACDIQETDDHYILNFDIPGIEKDNLVIEVRGNQLLVSGEEKQESKESKGQTRLTERRIRKYERVLTIPNDAKCDNIEADYRNGVLTIAMEKAQESKHQRIKIGEAKEGFLHKLLGDRSQKEKKVIDIKSTESASAH